MWIKNPAHSDLNMTDSPICSMTTILQTPNIIHLQKNSHTRFQVTRQLVGWCEQVPNNSDNQKSGSRSAFILDPGSRYDKK